MQILSIMQPHYKIVLDQRRPKKDNLYPVKIRITLNRVQKYYTIGIDLEPDNFDRILKGSVRKELRNIKDKIIDWESRTKKILDRLEPFSFEEFKYQLYNRQVIKIPDVYLLFESKINKLRQSDKISTGNIYNDAKNSFKSFKSKLNLIEITPEFLQKYELHMLTKDRSITTISMYIRCLRSLYNKAVDDGLIDRKYYPFGRNKFQPKAPRNIKKALTISQIKNIIDYKVKEGSNQQLAKDMWLLSYYCNGMNIKDIINLKFKDIQGDTLYYERKKTTTTNRSSKPIIVTLIPEALAIIQRWRDRSNSPHDYVFNVFKKYMTELERQQVKHQFIKTINKY